MKIGDVEQALERLKAFETMTWAEIESHQSHYLGDGDLKPEAMNRLKAMELEDEIDDLFSLRVTSAVRVVGIRHDSVLHLLWWDGSHGVAKSKYKQ